MAGSHERIEGALTAGPEMERAGSLLNRAAIARGTTEPATVAVLAALQDADPEYHKSSDSLPGHVAVSSQV